MSIFQKVFLTAFVILLGFFVYILAPVVTPFLLGGLLAYLGNPLVNKLVRCHLPRVLAVSVVFIFILALVVWLLVELVPLLEDQVLLLVNKVPVFLNWLQNTAVPWVETKSGINITDLDFTAMTSVFTADWQQTGHLATGFFKTLAHSGMAVFVILLNLILIPVVTFYLLRDWLVLTKKSKDLIPRKYLPVTTEILTECNEVLGAFFRGQLLVMLALGIFYSVTLKFIGLEFAVLLGVIIAALSIVPYLGTIIGLIIGIVAVLFQFADVQHIFYILGIFVAGHVLESLILAPLLIGDRIGLHPVAVIFAILAGGRLFGFLGVLLALPVAAVVMVWIRYFHHHYLSSSFYQK